MIDWERVRSLRIMNNNGVENFALIENRKNGNSKRNNEHFRLDAQNKRQ